MQDRHATFSPLMDGGGAVCTTPFDFQGHKVHVTDRGGNPWFVHNDACRVLEIGNPSQALTRLDGDEKSALILNDPHGRPQMTTIISEAGLYSLILTSKKPQAKAFKRWVTHDVIPTARGLVIRQMT